eukprot:315039-Prymnesium_polylepis.1
MVDSSPHGALGGLKTPPLAISTHSGKKLTSRSDVNAAHWVQHARDPVAFREAVGVALGECKCTAVVEVGMQPHLTQHVATNASASEAAVTAASTLRKGHDDSTRLFEAIGQLWCASVEVVLEGLIPTGDEARVPVTPFRGSRFWLPESATAPRARGGAPPPKRRVLQ